MTIKLEARITCNTPNCVALAIVPLVLRRDRHLDSGYIIEVDLPKKWTAEIIGTGHRCELHEDPDHKRERIAYEQRRKAEQADT